MKSICTWLAVLVLLTACGTSQGSDSSPTAVPTPTAMPTAVPSPSRSPTAIPRVPSATPTRLPAAAATAVPLLDSISVVRISQSWSAISGMLADATLQEAGEVSAAQPYSQDIPFKIEGITLVVHVVLSVNKTADEDVTGVLYSRSDRTQWLIPIVVTHKKSEGEPLFRVDTVAQNPGNTLSRSAIPADLKITVYR